MFKVTFQNYFILDFELSKVESRNDFTSFSNCTDFVLTVKNINEGIVEITISQCN